MYRLDRKTYQEKDFFSYVQDNLLDLRDFEFKNTKEVKRVFSFLKKNPKITTLKSGWLTFTSGGEEFYSRLREFAFHLARNKTLTLLDMSSNNLGDDGVTLVASVLTENTTLKSLNLSNTYMDDEGFRHLIRKMRDNRHLTTLNICDNIFGQHNSPYGDDNVTLFADFIKNNTTLQSLVVDHDMFFEFFTFDDYKQYLANESIKQLTDAFTQNETLASLHCRHGYRTSLNPEVLIKILEKNKGIVELQGVSHPKLDEYIRRNRFLSKNRNLETTLTQGLGLLSIPFQGKKDAVVDQLSQCQPCDIQLIF